MKFHLIFSMNQIQLSLDFFVFRSTLKKIGFLKKCSNLDDVDEDILASILRGLMDKGVRSKDNVCVRILIFRLEFVQSFFFLSIYSYACVPEFVSRDERVLHASLENGSPSLWQQ